MSKAHEPRNWTARREHVAEISRKHTTRLARLETAKVVKSDAELIADAIATGRVTHVPRGVSGLDPDLEAAAFTFQAS